MPQTPLSEILRVERARRDLGLVEASKEIGINKETLARLEKGLGNPYFPTIKRIAEFYKLPIQDLLVAAAAADSGGAAVDEGDSVDPKAKAPFSPLSKEEEKRRLAEGKTFNRKKLKKVQNALEKELEAAANSSSDHQKLNAVLRWVRFSVEMQDILPAAEQGAFDDWVEEQREYIVANFEPVESLALSVH